MIRKGNESILGMFENIRKSNPMLGKILDYLQQNGVSLMDDGKGGTVPENPTPNASMQTAAAMQEAKASQDAVKSAQEAQVASR